MKKINYISINHEAEAVVEESIVPTVMPRTDLALVFMFYISSHNGYAYILFIFVLQGWYMLTIIELEVIICSQYLLVSI